MMHFCQDYGTVWQQQHYRHLQLVNTVTTLKNPTQCECTSALITINITDISRALITYYHYYKNQITITNIGYIGYPDYHFRSLLTGYS